MDNAIAAQEALDLRVGVGLTAEQMAALTHDIVWLEEQEIDDQKVLAPVLYLAQLDERNVRGGAVIQGRDVELIAGGDLVNVGTIRARDSLTASSGGSILQGGLVEAGGKVDLTARNDIRNALSGEIRGDDVRLVATEGDIVNDRLAVVGGSDRSYQTYIDEGGLIEARNDLEMRAGRDIVNRSEILSGDDALLAAGRDIRIEGVEDVRGSISRRRIGRTTTIGDVEQIGASIAVGDDLALVTGQDVKVTASDVQAGGSLAVVAERDIDIASAANESHWEYDGRYVDANQHSTEQVGATLSGGEDVTLQAGQDVRVVASRIEAGEDLAIDAGNDIRLSSAANRESSEFDSRRLEVEEREVRQQGAELVAGDDVAIKAGNDLTLAASTVEAENEAYLYARHQVALTTAYNEDYYRREKESSGAFFKETSRTDMVHDQTAVGSDVTTGGDLSIVSGGHQGYVGAQLDAGEDLKLTSGGQIVFANASDFRTESHEKSSSNALWQSAKGEGETVETLRQSQLTAQGEMLINAAQGVNIQIEGVNEQTVSQTIDAMVEADPSLAWLKDMEARGDIDWEEVKAVHDSWDYDHSGMSGVAQIVVAIVVAYFTAGAASGLVASTAGATGAGAGAAVGAGAGAVAGVGAGTAAGAATASAWAVGGWANAAVTASITGVASNTAVSTINNQGNLSAVWQDISSEDALRGYAVAGATAGLTNGLYNDWTSTETGLPNALPNGASVSMASGLDTALGVGQFAGNQLLQNGTSALLDRALGGDADLGDSLQAGLANTFAAAGFNAIGDFTQGNPYFENGSLSKAGLKAVMGGLAAEAAGGDFRTGAIAAGANELLIGPLAEQYDDMPLAQKNQLLVMNSQVIGALAAAGTNGVNDAEGLQIGAQVAGSATQYNRALHPSEQEAIGEKARELQEQYGEPLDGLSWDDMLTLVSGAELDAQQAADFEQLLSRMEAGEGSYLEQRQFEQKLQMASSAVADLREQSSGEVLTWENGDPIIAHGDVVRPFQSTEGQYQDGELFGGFDAGPSSLGYQDGYGAGQSYLHQDEIEAIGANSSDIEGAYANLEHTARPGEAESADWVYEGLIDLGTAGAGTAATKAAGRGATGAIRYLEGRLATNKAGGERLLWGSWNDYPKVTAGGREYAQIGDRVYTRHAVDRMQPSGLGAPAGADGPGRNVTPNMVEEVIAGGAPATATVNGVQRTSYTLGNVRVWTEDGGRTIVTILRIGSQ